jgi:hypothetical protein
MNRYFLQKNCNKFGSLWMSFFLFTPPQKIEMKKIKKLSFKFEIKIFGSDLF